MPDRHGCADDEQADGGEQRPHVCLAAIAERTPGIGGVAALRRLAIEKNTSLPVSAQECAASAIIDAEPDTAAAAVLAAAIARFAPNATSTVSVLSPPALTTSGQSPRRRSCATQSLGTLSRGPGTGWSTGWHSGSASSGPS